MKLLHIVGNRPQFVKLSPMLKASQGYRDIRNIIVHSGQHHDYNMSKVFFEGFGIPNPDYNLEVGSGTHGVQTGKILMGLDQILLKEAPDCVVVYGDTNTTLAGALAAYKLHFPCAHVESGMREYIWRPEEMNKRIADHCSDFLFCPIKRAVDNLIREGIAEDRIFLTGDVTYDAYTANSRIAEKSDIFDKHGINSGNYILLTLHRAETVDNYKELHEIVETLTEIEDTIVFPMHPRVSKRLTEFELLEKLEASTNMRMLEPLGYFEFLKLLNHSNLVMTDSGGVIKEAFFARKPGIIIDDSTEYIEIVELGCNTVAGKSRERILKAYREMLAMKRPTLESNLFGDGHAAEKILEILLVHNPTCPREN